MLVLSRKRDEKIVINGNITITIVEIRGNTARLGIDAPHGMPILRKEIMNRPNQGDQRNGDRSEKESG